MRPGGGLRKETTAVSGLDLGCAIALGCGNSTPMEVRAAPENAALPPELGTKIRTHMKIRGKVGDPCARCGTKIVRTRHGLDEMFVCPKCQPPPKGQLR